MKRNFLLGLILCLIPVALASLFVGKAVVRENNDEVGFRRGVDLAGAPSLSMKSTLKASNATLPYPVATQIQSRLTKKAACRRPTSRSSPRT